MYVLGRDQIAVHDRNPGEADFYEAFNNDIMIGGGGHSYATCLNPIRKGIVFLRCAEGTPQEVLLKVSAMAANYPWWPPAFAIPTVSA